VRDVQIIRREKDDHDFNAWLVRFKDGRTQEIDPGDLWDFNEREIVARLEGYGMVVRKAR